LHQGSLFLNSQFQPTVGQPPPVERVEHVPESSIEILGHSGGGITDRQNAHRVPLAFWAIMILPQPTAFTTILKGIDGDYPCYWRRFADAG
jgi:hypothetical protein